MARDGADDATPLAPVIDLFGARRTQAAGQRSAPSSPPPCGESDADRTEEPQGQTLDPGERLARAKAAFEQIVAESAQRQTDAEVKADTLRSNTSSVDYRRSAADTADDEDAAAYEERSLTPATAAPPREDARRSPSASPTRAEATARARWSAPGAGLSDESDESDGTRASLPRLSIEEASTWALSRRGLSVEEMRKKLLDKGYPADQIDDEIDRLVRARYLDDARLAEEIVRVEFERKGKGRAVVIGELRRRGIAPDDYSAALDDIDSDLELQRAIDIAFRKMASSRSLDPHIAERRLSAFLARRGFSGDLVRTAIMRANERIGAGD